MKPPHPSSNVQYQLTVEETCEGLVSDIPNHLVICRTSEGFIPNMWYHLVVVGTLDGSVCEYIELFSNMQNF